MASFCEVYRMQPVCLNWVFLYDRLYSVFQAVNRVGLIAVSTSSAVVVDGSPPVAGHVYDVINASHTNDIDYTVRIVFIFKVRH